MSTYRKEWDCCGSVTETEAWEPEHCPFCTKSRLEAAAPELLAALQVVREAAWPHLHIEQQKQIDAAIAKATGEQA